MIIKPSITNIEIESYTTVWSQTVIENDGSVRKGINTMRDKVIVRNDSIIRSMHWEDTSSNTYTKTDVLNKSTLQPLSIDIRWSPEYIQHTDIYTNKFISTTLNSSTSNSSISISELDSNAFTWSSDGFVLVSIIGQNIKDKFSIRIIENHPKHPKLELKTFRVYNKEELQIKNIGKIMARKIEAINNNKTLITYWLCDLKPYIVKVKFQQENGQTTIWNIETVE